MIARDRSSSQIARSASTVALASRPGGGVPTHFRYTPCIVMSSSTGASNPRSPDHGGSPVQLAARAALERLRRQAARFSTASSSLTHENTRKSGSQRARCWREHDAEGHRYSFGNGIAELPDSRIRGRRRRMGVRFALDSLLEGAGFEPSISRSREGTSGAKSDLKEGALAPTISALRSRRE
jgi:hypothetical protein